MDSAHENDRILTPLGHASRLFLEKGREAAFPELSSGLEFLLTRHWAEAGLVPTRSFDGLACAKVTKRSSDELEVLGMMIDIETQETEWFYARLSLSPGSTSVRSHKLRHGLVGVPPVPFDSSRRHFEKGLPALSTLNWIHEFVG